MTVLPISPNEALAPSVQWQLILASYRGDLRLLHAALDNGAVPAFAHPIFALRNEFPLEDGGRVFWKGDAALTISAAHGHTEIVKVLLQYNHPPEVLGRALYEAAFQRHLELVERLINAGAPFSCIGDWDDETTILGDIMRLTIDRKEELPLDIIKTLLTNGADPEGKNQYGPGTPLSGAVFLGNHKAIEMLLESGANVNGEDVLSCAITRRDPDLVTKLLKLGALIRGTDPNVTNPNANMLWVAASDGNLEVVKILIDECERKGEPSRNDDGLLHGAVYGGKSDIVEYLLKAGFDIEAKFGRRTPLITAAKFKRKNMIELLLDNGALIDSKDDINGETALFEICKGLMLDPKGDFENNCFKKTWGHGISILNLLLSRGASPNTRNYHGRSPLYFTISIMERWIGVLPLSNLPHNEQSARILSQDGMLEATKILLEAGADPKIYDNQRVSPLHLAANSLNLEFIITILKSVDMDLNFRDDAGCTPLHYAVTSKTLYDTLSSKRDKPRPLRFPCSYVVQTLIALGADATIQDKEGRTALDELRESIRETSRYRGFDHQDEVDRVTALLEKAIRIPKNGT